MLWHDYVQKAPIDPFTRERCKPSASQGVPLGGMGYLMWLSYMVQFLVLEYFMYLMVANHVAGVAVYPGVSEVSSGNGKLFLELVMLHLL